MTKGFISFYLFIGIDIETINNTMIIFVKNGLLRRTSFHQMNLQLYNILTLSSSITKKWMKNQLGKQSQKHSDFSFWCKLDATNDSLSTFAVFSSLERGDPHLNAYQKVSFSFDFRLQLASSFIRWGLSRSRHYAYSLQFVSKLLPRIALLFWIAHLFWDDY